MSKDWAPELDQFFIAGETPEARKAALECFVLLVRDGDQIPASILTFVADGIDDYLSGSSDPWPNPKGRPSSGPSDWKTWAAWFAVRCDPQFAVSPLTTEGRYQAVSEKLPLRVSARQVENLVKRHAQENEMPDFMLLHMHWCAYARHMGWPESEETHKRMQGWLPRRN